MSGSLITLVLFWTAFGLIVYTYVLFPLILAMLARMFGDKSQVEPELATNQDLPRVAMIVAAYNESGVMAAKLSNTWQIDYPASKFKILIGSDGSDDGTAAILQDCRDERLRAIAFSRRRGKISVLNDLLSETDAEIVVMSDANTMFAPDAVQKLVAHFKDERVGCVSGKLSIEQDGGVSGEGLYWRYEGWIKQNESRLGFLIGCNGGIFALRRALYDPLPASTIIEDFVLTLRIIEKRWLVRFEPNARAAEPPCRSSRAEMTRKVRIGAGGWQALGLTRSVLGLGYGAAAFAFWGHKVLRWLVPHFYLVGVVSNIVLAFSSVSLMWRAVYMGLLAIQAFGVLVALAAYRAGAKSLPRWSRPISYFYLMNYSLALGFLRFLFRTQRVTWDRETVSPAPAHSESQPMVANTDSSA